MQREIETLKNILGVEPLEEENSSKKAFHIKKDKDLNLIKLENLLIQNAFVNPKHFANRCPKKISHENVDIINLIEGLDDDIVSLIGNEEDYEVYNI